MKKFHQNNKSLLKVSFSSVQSLLNCYFSPKKIPKTSNLKFHNSKNYYFLFSSTKNIFLEIADLKTQLSISRSIVMFLPVPIYSAYGSVRESKKKNLSKFIDQLYHLLFKFNSHLQV